MSDKERKEHSKLLKLWSERHASMSQMLRCMDLDRKAASHAKQHP